jgi:uncharacterized protein DUF4157
VAVPAAGGRPLEPTVLAEMESSFGHDFSRVRVHSGDEASSMAQRRRARAYTVGHDIVLGSGEAVTGGADRRLLAHELAHVVQYDRSGRAVLARQPSPPVAPAAPVAPGTAAVIHYEEITLPGGRVRMRAWGKVGDPLPRSGYEANWPGPGEVGLPGMDRWHLAGPDATGGEIGIAYAPRNFNVSQTAAVENVVRISRAYMRVEGGDVFFDFEADCRIVGEHEGVSIRVVEDVRWQIDGRLPGSDDLIHILDQRAAVPAMTPPTTPPSVPAPAAPGEGPAPTSERAPSGTAPEPGPAVTPEVEPGPEVTPTVEVPGVGAVGDLALKTVVAEIGVNLLLAAVSYYLNKWHAEKQISLFNNDIQGLLPEINSRLKNRTAEILENSKAFPLVYGNITILYTHDKYQVEDYNEGSMSVFSVGISHQNYQTRESPTGPRDPSSDNDPEYSLTFSVPLFDEKTAEKGASSLVRDYRQVREELTYPAYKVRLSAVIALYKLAMQDSSLRTLVIRDLLGALRDEDSTVRMVSAAFLSRLQAKIAIPYIQEVLAITTDDEHRELIERYLHQLQQS